MQIYSVLPCICLHTTLILQGTCFLHSKQNYTKTDNELNNPQAQLLDGEAAGQILF
jgi:hypothetical protein